LLIIGAEGEAAAAVDRAGQAGEQLEGGLVAGEEDEAGIRGEVAAVEEERPIQKVKILQGVL